MKSITLKGGEKTSVDDALYAILDSVRWYLDKDGYVLTGRNKRFGGARRMSRIIMCAPDGLVVDHINGDRLDNRSANLRLCTTTQNLQNRSINKKKKSTPYKGVYRYGDKWIAQIKKRHIGVFLSDVEAARAYDSEAVRVFGSFAKYNLNT